MHALLIHNPASGSGSPTPSELTAWLRDVGLDVTYQSAKDNDFFRKLDGATDVVIAAGGDGTVTKIAKRLVGRDHPLGIIPLGTSNNVASAMGIRGDVPEIIAGLRMATRRKLDVPTARATWGNSRFIESAGLGAFAGVLRDAIRSSGHAPTDMQGTDDVETGGRRFQRVLRRRRPRRVRVEADGRDLSGHYVLVEAMNISQIGARARLAPAADPGDGLLDLVLVGAAHSESLGVYLDALADGEPSTPDLPTIRAKHVVIGWRIGAGHLDDKLWPLSTSAEDHLDADVASHPEVEIEVVEPAIEVLVPAPA
jgi:diacylglycerol kinase (ATP)